MRRLLAPLMVRLGTVLLLGASTWAAQQSAFPESLSIMDPKEAGQLLAQKLRSSEPTESSSLKGTIKIRRKGSATVQIPFHFEAQPGSSNWQAKYETASAGDIPAEALTIIYSPNAPNQYLFTRARKPGEPTGPPARLVDDQAAVPLASSDFWLTDLGLEFSHWPAQRYLKGEMRESRYCYVLESTNPHPTDSGYGRVISWVDQETGGVILAEGYDRQGKLLKEFSIRSFKKVEGQWQLQEMEIRNAQTRSRTRLEFDYTKK